MLTKEEMLKAHDMLTRMDLNDAYTREGLSPILDRSTFTEYEASLCNLIYQSYSESFSKEELSQLEFIAKETGRTKSEVLKDLIKRESHLLYYGYYSR